MKFKFGVLCTLVYKTKWRKEMGNQQPSSLDGLITLAKNAKFGDGYLWRHPECVNSKVIFTSTDYGLLEAKMSICPTVFPSGITLYRKEGAETNYCLHSKALYKLASIVHPIFTKYHRKEKETALLDLTEEDFYLWYLDDGYCEPRPPKYRFTLSIGNSATGSSKMTFLSVVNTLFGGIKTRNNSVGTIKKNNSKASENNMTWSIPTPIGIHISNGASLFYNMPNKCPYAKGPETISEESTTVGIISRKRWQIG